MACITLRGLWRPILGALVRGEVRPVGPVSFASLVAVVVDVVHAHAPSVYVDANMLQYA